MWQRLLHRVRTTVIRGSQIGQSSSCAGSRDVAAFQEHWTRVLTLNNVPEPKWSVRWIVEHVLNPEKDGTTGRRVFSQLQLDKANRMMEKRFERMPVQYIIGEWEFRNVTLTMRPPVFIPRPCTEQLVGLVIDSCCHGMNSHKKTPQRFLDVGCGSGAIAISLLQECEELEGYAVDISKDAVELTKENAIRNGVSKRLSVFHCSAEQCCSLFSQNQMDFIVSNPPYVLSKEISSLQPEIARYEDHRALDGGEEGLDQAATILAMARHILKKNREVWLEMGLGHSDGIQRLSQLHQEWELEYISTYRDFTERYTLFTVVNLVYTRSAACRVCTLPCL